jgi:3-oxoacyl-[acyl-carrier protein] reductase
VTAGREKRVVLVTGASRGLGRALALRFGNAHTRVVVNYLSREADAAAVVREIAQKGGEGIPFRADVRIPADVEAMVRDTIDRWGAIDVLINNAGVAKDSLLLRMPEQDWDEVIESNLSGAFHMIRSAAKIMKKKRKGHIISIASLVGVRGREGQANYSASKAGLIGLTKACALELGRFNIQANAVLPGWLHTDMGSAVSHAVYERVQKENALGRSSDLTEVADFVYHLSSMNNVSGQIFNLDSRML